MQISKKFNMQDSRTVENKILNYRFLSGEGRGLQKAAKVAEYIVGYFEVFAEDDFAFIFDSIMNDEKLKDSLNGFLIDVTCKW